ncbi:MAG: flavin reductase family protein [Cytophagales bacterium]|nr:flavin reductase family protein [Bernardetiaceae bacterium]MDW8205670.1 flavin reductase family protein [Cytophagales bacterium]
MKRSVLKFKNYEVHSVTTAAEGKKNANIATWIMQSGMKGTFLSVALYKIDYTIELVRQSGILNVNLLSWEQQKLVNKLGRKSGRQIDKFKNLPHAIDERGCPYLTEAIGYIACQVHDTADSGDHEIFTCRILRQVVLHPEKQPLTYQYLKQAGFIR